VVLKHDLHRAQDRGRFGLEPTQAPGNLPESRDPGTTEAKNGSEAGGVHGRRLSSIYFSAPVHGFSSVPRERAPPLDVI